MSSSVVILYCLSLMVFPNENFWPAWCLTVSMPNILKAEKKNPMHKKTLFLIQTKTRNPNVPFERVKAHVIKDVGVLSIIAFEKA